MGLFSSKKVTRVGTTVKRLVENDALPNAVKSGMFKALLGDGAQASIPEYVLEELTRSLGVRSERLYEWAKRAYTHGLPQHLFKDTQTIRAMVAAHLNSEHPGSTVVLDYCRLAGANDLHIAWMALIANHGYDPVTNELPPLTAIKGSPVYLEDMVVVIAADNLEGRSPESFEKWGLPPTSGVTPLRTAAENISRLRGFTPTEADPNVTTDYVRVTVVWKTSAPGQPVTVERESFNISTYLGEEEEELEADYIHVRYLLDDVPVYWMYRVGSGGNAALDDLLAHDFNLAGGGAFFPMCYFRFDKTSLNDEGTNPAYADSVKFCKYLGLDFHSLTDSINENPDITDVEQAMLMFGVPAVSTNQVECRYLFDFFENLFYENDYPLNRTPQEVALERLLLNADPINSTLNIRDKKFRMALSNDGIYRKLVAGVVAPVGDYTASYEEEILIHRFEYDPGEGGGTSVVYDMEYPVKKHLYRHQITPNVYVEVLVSNLRMQFYIYGHHNALADEDDDILLIPVDHSISMDYSSIVREELYSRSLHFVFNSRVVTKVKWYQQGWFAALLTIVAIVVTIMTWGSTSSLLASSLSIAAGTAAYLVLAIVEYIVVQTLVSQVITLFVKAVGLEGAFLLAVAAAIAGGFSQLSKMPFMGMDAKTLLSATILLFQGVGSAAASLMSDLRSEANDFSQWMKEQTKLLDNAQDLLNQNTFLAPYTIFGETPGDFYNRTVHAGNVGVLGYSAVSSFVDIALKLPSLNDTAGEGFHDQ